MARHNDERTFSVAGRDVVVMVTQYDAFEALDLFTKLLDVIAPSAGTIISGLVRGAFEELATIEGPELAEALQGTIGKIFDRSRREAMIFQIFRGTQVRVDDKVFAPTSTAAVGVIFEADMAALFRVLGFALEVQYGDFWHAVSAQIALRQAQVEAAKAEAVAAAKAKAAQVAMAARAAAEALSA